MTYEWRKAAGFCIKKDGDICLVAPSSPRCWAVSSSDTAPMAIALGALVTLAGAAVALRLDGSTVTSCRIVLSAVASHPLEADEASEFMVGKEGDEESIRAAAEIAGRPAKPLDNADLSHFWRKRMVRVIVEQALRSAIDQ